MKNIYVVLNTTQFNYIFWNFIVGMIQQSPVNAYDSDKVKIFLNLSSN